MKEAGLPVGSQPPPSLPVAAFIQPESENNGGYNALSGSYAAYTLGKAGC
jgi:hypothetical protein